MVIEDRNKKYYFFLDETGDHGLTMIDERFPLFLLAGCLFEEKEYEKVSNELNAFKREFFNTTEVILHSREIRKCEGAFQILLDLTVKQKFYEKLNKILSTESFTIITVAINKKNYIEKYGKSAQNPYSMCLSFMLERLVFSTDDNGRDSHVSILIEKRGKKEDIQLIAHYNSVIDMGTNHVTAEQFKKRIEKFEMQWKKDNEIGLQISDLCAYPIARHILNSEEPYIPFLIIQSKLRRKGKEGTVDGYGIKIFP